MEYRAERIAELKASIAELRADAAERKERIDAGLGQDWTLPSETPRLTREVNEAIAAKAKELDAHLKRLRAMDNAIIDGVAQAFSLFKNDVQAALDRVRGETDSKVDAVRASIREDSSADLRKQVARVLDARASSEEFKSDVKRELLKYETQVAELRKELEKLRRGRN